MQLRKSGRRRVRDRVDVLATGEWLRTAACSRRGIVGARAVDVGGHVDAGVAIGDLIDGSVEHDANERVRTLTHGLIAPTSPQHPRVAAQRCRIADVDAADAHGPDVQPRRADVAGVVDKPGGAADGAEGARGVDQGLLRPARKLAFGGRQ